MTQEHVALYTFMEQKLGIWENRLNLAASKIADAEFKFYEGDFEGCIADCQYANLLLDNADVYQSDVDGYLQVLWPLYGYWA